MGKLVGIIFALLLGAAAALATVYLGWVPQLGRVSAAKGSSSPDPAADGGAATSRPPVSQVVALARFEPAGGIVDLAGTPGDRVQKLLVHSGDQVKRDAEMIVFESQTQRKLETETAKIQLSEAERRLQSERQLADANVQTAQTAIDSLELDDLELSVQQMRSKSLELAAQIAHNDYERLSKLDSAVSSPQQLDHAKLARDQAAAELAATQESLKKLEVGRNLRRKEAKAKFDQAQAARDEVEAAVPVESLKKSVALSEERLKQAVLRAPFDGTILEVLTDEGDTIGTTPLVRLADLSAMVASAEVYETQVHAIAPGQPATITSESLAAPLTGVVERIGLLVGKNRLLSYDPRQSTDNRIVEVRIRLNDPTAAARLINMQVTATIDTTKK